MENQEESSSKEKSFACKICGKSFPTKQRQESHELVHTKIRKFRCNDCDYRGRRQHDLYDHIAKHHGPNATVKRPYKRRRNGEVYFREKYFAKQLKKAVPQGPPRKPPQTGHKNRDPSTTTKSGSSVKLRRHITKPFPVGESGYDKTVKKKRKISNEPILQLKLRRLEDETNEEVLRYLKPNHASHGVCQETIESCTHVRGTENTTAQTIIDPSSIAKSTRIRRHHPNSSYKDLTIEGGMSCKFCKYVGPSERGVVMHYTKKHLEMFLPFKCPIEGCSSGNPLFINAHSVTIHVCDKHTREEIDALPDYIKVFYRLRDNIIERHVKQKNAKLKSKKLISCPYCSFKTPSARTLNGHFVQKHAEKFKPYKCPIANCASANHMYTHKCNLIAHVLNLHTKSERDLLDRHVQIFLKIDDDSINNSSIVTTTNRKLPTRRKVAKKATNKIVRKRENEDTRRKRLNLFLTCPKCPKKFRVRKAFQSHVRWAHEKSNDSEINTQSGRYCFACTHYACTYTGLRYHIMIKHPEVQPLNCPVQGCKDSDKTFSQKNSLEYHIKLYHTKEEIGSLSEIKRFYFKLGEYDNFSQGKGKKVYRCDHCSVKYESYAFYKTHRSTFGLSVPSAEEFERDKFVMNKTSGAVRTRALRGTRMKRQDVHADDVPIEDTGVKCEFCSAKFTSGFMYDTHVIAAHSERYLDKHGEDELNKLRSRHEGGHNNPNSPQSDIDQQNHEDSEDGYIRIPEFVTQPRLVKTTGKGKYKRPNSDDDEDYVPPRMIKRKKK